jgi:hypothetical protein
MSLASSPELLAPGQHYDADVALVSSIARTPGYHTKIPDGERVHDIRLSAHYAAACLKSGDGEHIARGLCVVERLISLQDTDPFSPTFGLWPWFYEEPVQEMTPPDWNWADFIAAPLLHIAREARQHVPAALITRLQLAIERAALCIFRRNSPISYTNIAIMGAGVCAAAGEELNRPVLLEYGRHKLQEVLRLAAQMNCFPEYNSPIYTMVAIEECERILHLVQDPETRAAAEGIHALAWKMVGEHWHAPTCQWAGPHGRTYGDTLGPVLLRRISIAIGAPLPGAGAGHSISEALPPIRPCPAEVAPLFTSPLTTPRTVRMHLDLSPEGVAKVGVTWLAPSCCLASVTREHTWAQRRPLIAYWPTAGGVAVFKTQWLHNGKSMTAMRLARSQCDNRVLMAAYPLFQVGSFHPSFFIPSDDTFDCEDLRFRFSLAAPGAMANELGNGVYELQAGDHRVRIALAPSLFAGEPIHWELQCSDGGATLDGVCLSQPARVNFKTLTLRLAAAIELLAPGLNPRGGSPALHYEGEQRRVEWPGGEVSGFSIPTKAQPFSW